MMVLGYFIFGFRYKTLDRLDYRDTSLITVYLIVIEISIQKIQMNRTILTHKNVDVKKVTIILF